MLPMAGSLAMCSDLINIKSRESPCARVKRKKQTQLDIPSTTPRPCPLCVLLSNFESSQNIGKRVIKLDCARQPQPDAPTLTKI